MELGFRIPILSGIPDSKAQDFLFHMKKIPDSGLPYTDQFSFQGNCPPTVLYPSPKLTLTLASHLGQNDG